MGTGIQCLCCPCVSCGGSAYTTNVEQGWVSVVTRFGRFNRILPPGRHRYNTMAETIIPVNLKTCCLDIKPQEVMTADNLSIKIDAVCYYRVLDAKKATFSVDNYKFALSNLAAVTLRTVLGEFTLGQIFANRSQLNARLKTLIDEASDRWGIQVGRVEISDIALDKQMQRAMAAKAEANAQAEAKVIQARAQRDASSILAEAAQFMEGQPASIQLQWMETLRIVATQGKTSTIIIPPNMESMAALAAAGTAAGAQVGVPGMQAMAAAGAFEQPFGSPMSAAFGQEQSKSRKKKGGMR